MFTEVGIVRGDGKRRTVLLVKDCWIQNVFKPVFIPLRGSNKPSHSTDRAIAHWTSIGWIKIWLWQSAVIIGPSCPRRRIRFYLPNEIWDVASLKSFSVNDPLALALAQKTQSHRNQPRAEVERKSYDYYGARPVTCLHPGRTGE